MLKYGAVLLPVLLGVFLVNYNPYPFDISDVEVQIFEPLPFNHDAFKNYVRNNQKLNKTEMMLKGSVHGPECLIFDKENYMYTGTEDGKILKISPSGSVTVLAITGGRPLGIEFGPEGSSRIYVADAVKGLLLVDEESHKTLLAKVVANFTEDGSPISLADALDIAKDGTIYFSDATRFVATSSENILFASTVETVAAVGSGRVLKYDPLSKKTSVLMKDLCFSNGILLAEDESYFLVTETGKYRIWKHWLKGEKAGTSEIFVENLPGMPDNIARDANGDLWVALYQERHAYTDFIMSSKLLRFLLLKILPSVPIKPSITVILKLHSNGTIADTFVDATGRFASTTHGILRNNKLYLGSLHNDFIGVLDLDKL